MNRLWTNRIRNPFHSFHPSRHTSSETLNKHPINLRFIPPRDVLLDIYIGTPPQKFSVLLDTGSTELWVRHAALTPHERGSKFLPLQSETWHQSRSHWGIKYLDSTIAEGLEGIERVRLGEFEFDARLGVAEKITEARGNKRVRTGRVLGIKAGHVGFQGIDGILGFGLDSSVVHGLRDSGARGIKITFGKKESREDKLEILTDTDAEGGVAWYRVRTSPDDAAWAIDLKRVGYENTTFPAFSQKMVVDTGSVHHYLPANIAKALFGNEPLSPMYMEIHIASNHSTASEKSESGWLLVSPPGPKKPISFEFVGSKHKWEIPLASPIGDEYASIRSAAHGGQAVLGMPFISGLKGIIFDFTKGNERIGFISGEKIENEEILGTRPRERFLQFFVGGLLGLGIVGGWKWYEGSLF